MLSLTGSEITSIHNSKIGTEVANKQPSEENMCTGSSTSPTQIKGERDIIKAELTKFKDKPDSQ